MTTTKSKAPESAAAGPANIDPGVPPMPQEFLRGCEQVASEEAAKFFTAFAVGAKVTPLGETSFAHVAIRFLEPHFAGFDLEAAIDVTEGMTLEDQRNAWGQALPQLISQQSGLVRIATEQPAAPPPSDVEPEEPPPG